MWLKSRCLLFAVLCLLSWAASAQDLSTGQQIDNSLESLTLNLLDTAQSIKTYQSNTLDLLSQIEALQTQKEYLMKAGQAETEAYKNLESRLTDYFNQVLYYQSKVQTMQNNFLGLLKLSDKYKVKLESSIKLNNILAAATITLVLAVIIESIVLANKK